MSFVLEVQNQKGSHISEFFVAGTAMEASAALIKSEGVGPDKVLVTVVI